MLFAKTRVSELGRFGRPVIAQVHTSLADGGSERHVLTLARGLRSDASFQGVICCPPNSWLCSAAEDDGIEVATLGQSEAGMTAVRHLARTMRSRRVAIIHSHTAWGDAVAAVAAVIARVPVRVSTRHSTTCECLYTSGAARRALLRFSHGLTRLTQTKTIAVSQAVREAMYKHGSAPAARTAVIYNGVDVSVNDYARHRLALSDRRRFGLRAEDWVAACVGRLSPEKGQRYLLEAVGVARTAIHNLRVVVAGDGPDLEALKAQARAAGIQDIVSFLGWTSDIPSLLRAANVLVQPSTREGFGLAVAEAMAAGCPVVCTAVGGIPELVDHDSCGILVPPRDPTALALALTTLSEQPALAVRLAAAAHRRVETHFSASRMMDDLKRVYRELLAEPDCTT